MGFQMPETQQENYAAAEPVAQRRGINVIVALAVFTVVEFIIAIAMDGGNWLATFLGVVAIIKAVLIIQYFMHFHQLWENIVEVWNAMLYGEETASHD